MADLRSLLGIEEAAHHRYLSSGPSTIGYIIINEFNEADCSGDPKAQTAKSYGNCQPTATGYQVEYLSANDGSNVITSTIQAYSDANCNLPVGVPSSAPYKTPMFVPPVQIFLNKCTALQGQYFKVIGMTTYLPTPMVWNQNGAVVDNQITYLTQADCAAKQNPINVYTVSAPCSSWPKSDPVFKAYQINGAGQSIFCRCYSDSTCTTESTCPATLPIQIQMATIQSYLLRTCKADPTGSVNGVPKTVYVSACIAPDCLPSTGVLPVKSTPPAQVKQWIKIQEYSDSTCSGPFQEMALSVGECQKNWAGIKGVNSVIMTLTANSDGTMQESGQYFSDSACKTPSGTSFTSVKYSIPGLPPFKIGTCVQPPGISVGVTIQLLGPSMPTFVNSGLLTTGFESLDSCNSGATPTSLFLNNQAFCSKTTGSNTFQSVQSGCNATTSHTSMYSDANCQTSANYPGSKRPWVQYSPVDKTCRFQGADLFSSTSDDSLYEVQSCYTAPPVAAASASASSAPSTGTIVGAVLGALGAVIGIGAALYFYSKHKSSTKPLAEQQELPSFQQKQRQSDAIPPPLQGGTTQQLSPSGAAGRLSSAPGAGGPGPHEL